jgi:hypothetical protein
MAPGSGQHLKLSKRQKTILRWLTLEYKLYELEPDLEFTGDPGADTFSVFWRAGENLLNPYALRKKPKGAPWAPKAVLDKKLTPSDSATLAQSLARLEERGLVTRLRTGQVRPRTTRVKLTRAGLELCRELFKEESSRGS